MVLISDLKKIQDSRKIEYIICGHREPIPVRSDPDG